MFTYSSSCSSLDAISSFTRNQLRQSFSEFLPYARSKGASFKTTRSISFFLIIVVISLINFNSRSNRSFLDIFSSSRTAISTSLLFINHFIDLFTQISILIAKMLRLDIDYASLLFFVSPSHSLIAFVTASPMEIPSCAAFVFNFL